MLEVYLNYPNSKVTVHGDMACGSIRQRGKTGQRRVTVDRDTLDRELRRFAAEHGFGSTAAKNDMWVRLDFGNVVEEERTLGRIVETLGVRYTPFREADLERHC